MQRRRMGGARGFVECEGVLGGQFLTAVRIGGGTWCKCLFVSSKLLTVPFKPGYLAPDYPLSTNSSGSVCLQR